MQLYNSWGHAPTMSYVQSERLNPGSRFQAALGQWRFAAVLLFVSLLHGLFLTAWQRNPEPETPAKPLIMEVALVSEAEPEPERPKPAAVPVAVPKSPPKPVLQKKTTLPRKASKKKELPAKPAKLPQPRPVAVEEKAPLSDSGRSEPERAAPLQAPAPSSAAPVNKAPLRSETFTRADYRANYKSNPKPDYPRLAKSRGWQGKVLLRVNVTAQGRSAGIAVQQSSGHDLLDRAAVEAVQDWTFVPATRSGNAVASTVTVPILFKLND